MMFAFALNEIPKQANFPNESNLSFSSSARPSPHNAAAFVSTNDGRQKAQDAIFFDALSLGRVVIFGVFSHLYWGHGRHTA